MTVWTRFAAIETTAWRLLKSGGVVGIEHADAQGDSAPAVFSSRTVTPGAMCATTSIWRRYVPPATVTARKP